MLKESLESYDGTALGSFDVNKYGIIEGSTLGVSPDYTEGEALGSEEGMVIGTGKVLASTCVPVDNVKVGIYDGTDMDTLTVSL